jgi:hypothetical protein
MNKQGENTFIIELISGVKPHPVHRNHQTYKKGQTRGGFAYAIYRQLSGGSPVPLYAGESTNVYKRMDDYCRYDFKAATDFKIGVSLASENVRFS